MTFQELYKTYIQLNEPLLSSQTLKTYHSINRKHFAQFQEKQISSLNFTDYQIFINNLLKSGLKTKTVKNIKALLSVMYNLAIQIDKTEKNPLKAVKLPKFDNKRYFNKSIETQKKIIDSIKDYHKMNDKPFSDVLFFLLHGRRLGEVLKLRWNMVDLYTGVYMIPATINKAKQSQVHLMTDELKSMLFKRYDQYYRDDEQLVFENPFTKKRYSNFRKSWKRFLKDNNLPDMRLHDIRHLIATYSVNHLNVPVEHVSKVLGHTDITTTQKYLTLSHSISKTVIDRVLEA
ncbi:MAG: FIG00470376: hypothetical protein [uncultured Campylobacterales bacterium]|uniref:Uncharacterized protein n=1 Tax=uncultured Campylobacterales bacterium TaxID=352960 RepID=A0A6S6SPR3_9BACT|nr:MAG: FIG00470376: hypothetical protein [uncultured Campylobacterales bacterium]